ncbi:MAG TPA: hypothetical protein VF221_14460 [Chloroflexota bacterium]
MSRTVCLAANTLSYPNGGGYRWIYLNWALGLRALGYRVIWLEGADTRAPVRTVRERLGTLRTHLQPYDLADSVALCSWSDQPLVSEVLDGCLDVETAAAEAELLVNMQYSTRPEVVERFRRTALIDIDPGLLQLWMGTGALRVAPHDAYFTIGESLGEPGSRCSDAGVTWQRAAPCVALDWWPMCPTPENAPYTTLAHWSGGWTEFDGEVYPDDKRTAFHPYFDLPCHTSQRLELALSLAPSEDDERRLLEQHGWSVRDAYAVSSTPWDYEHYVRQSAGEFSCAKPSYVRMQTAWISDRTVCYLASGKPAIVQHTGPSRYLPDMAGIFRFRDLEEAACCLETAAADYERQRKLARTLAEEYFDARTVVGSVLERALA